MRLGFVNSPQSVHFLVTDGNARAMGINLKTENWTLNIIDVKTFCESV